MTKIQNSVALLVVMAAAFAGMTSVAFAHGTDDAGDDHSADVITLASAEAHIELAVEAREDAIAYVASLEDTDEDAWRGSVPHLAHLARDLASAQAALADERYTDAADLAQTVSDHAAEIMNGSVLVDAEMSTDDMATSSTHTEHDSMDMTEEVDADIVALQAQVRTLMQKLIQLLTLKLAAMQ